MTLIELVVTLWIISILSVIFLGIANGRIEKARLVKCMTDMRSIQSVIWANSDGMEFPNMYDFWGKIWKGARPGPYFYMTDAEDPNCGHGNDLDGFVEQNPGKSKRTAKDLKFVIVCQHDHGNLCKYVYIEDEGPPQLAMWDGKDPNYPRFLNKFFGGGTR